jgi:hypothetical protein
MRVSSAADGLSDPLDEQRGRRMERQQRHVRVIELVLMDVQVRVDAPFYFAAVGVRDITGVPHLFMRQDVVVDRPLPLGHPQHRLRVRPVCLQRGKQVINGAGGLKAVADEQTKVRGPAGLVGPHL